MNSKVKNILSWILQILLGLEYLIAGQAKFTSSNAWMNMFKNWGYPDGFYIVIGVIEILMAILLFFPKYAGYGASVLVVIMIGAATTHLVHDQNAIVDIILTLLLIILFFLRKPGFLMRSVSN